MLTGNRSKRLISPFHRAMRITPPTQTREYSYTRFMGMSIYGKTTTHTLLLERNEMVSIQATCSPEADNVPYFYMYDSEGKCVVCGVFVPLNNKVNNVNKWHKTGAITFRAPSCGEYRIEVQQNYPPGAGIYQLACQRIRDLTMARRQV